ncbi:hypothetical protein [Nonomuraea typhae]|uniref:Uncharacterized protein n=1 Tax=Nonomuraea typhae TaxID=2603600 RepID=A0ABW7YK79_9ACTN
MKSYKAPWLFTDDAEARHWVEYFVSSHINEEIPRDRLAGYVRHGAVETVDGKEQLVLTSIRTSICYSVDAFGRMRWQDAPLPTPPTAAASPGAPLVTTADDVVTDQRAV